ncbi:hypothetical protein BGX38DRAFT_1185528 [Terfezia claveryi]|nr:hypothetical protein BGX38DRAFT_1185528 [Terfezia claveryi]
MGFLSPGAVPPRYKKRKSKEGNNSSRPEKRSRSSSVDVLSSAESTPTSSRSSTPAPTRRKSAQLPPPPPHPPQSLSQLSYNLSPLELLPTELVQKVFLLSTNLSLPLASPKLHHLLADRFLQLKILYSAYNHPQALTDLISRRFFNAHILHTCESRYGPLDLTGVSIPARLLKAPFSPEHLGLLAELVTRGATLDPADRETPAQGLRQAIKLRCTSAISILVGVLGVRCPPETVALGIEAELPMQGHGSMEQLMQACSKRSDASIWWAALGATSRFDGNKFKIEPGVIGEVKKEMLEYLLKTATPPGEVLGAIGAIMIR